MVKIFSLSTSFQTKHQQNDNASHDSWFIEIVSVLICILPYVHDIYSRAHLVSSFAVWAFFISFCYFESIVIIWLYQKCRLHGRLASVAWLFTLLIWCCVLSCDVKYLLLMGVEPDQHILQLVASLLHIEYSSDTSSPTRHTLTIPTDPSSSASTSIHHNEIYHTIMNNLDLTFFHTYSASFLCFLLATYWHRKRKLWLIQTLFKVLRFPIMLSQLFCLRLSLSSIHFIKYVSSVFRTIRQRSTFPVNLTKDHENGTSDLVVDDLDHQDLEQTPLFQKFQVNYLQNNVKPIVPPNLYNQPHYLHHSPSYLQLPHVANLNDLHLHDADIVIPRVNTLNVNGSDGIHLLSTNNTVDSESSNGQHHTYRCISCVEESKLDIEQQEKKYEELKERFVDDEIETKGVPYNLHVHIHSQPNINKQQQHSSQQRSPKLHKLISSDNNQSKQKFYMSIVIRFVKTIFTCLTYLWTTLIIFIVIINVCCPLPPMMNLIRSVTLSSLSSPSALLFSSCHSKAKDPNLSSSTSYVDSSSSNPYPTWSLAYQIHKEQYDQNLYHVCNTHTQQHQKPMDQLPNIIVLLFETTSGLVIQSEDGRQAMPFYSKLLQNKLIYEYPMTISTSGASELAMASIITGISPQQQTKNRPESLSLASLAKSSGYHTSLYTSWSSYWASLTPFFLSHDLDFVLSSEYPHGISFNATARAFINNTSNSYKHYTQHKLQSSLQPMPLHQQQQQRHSSINRHQYHHNSSVPTRQDVSYVLDDTELIHRLIQDLNTSSVVPVDSSQPSLASSRTPFFAMLGLYSLHVPRLYDSQDNIYDTSTELGKYLNALHKVDRTIHHLFESLHQLGLDKNTVIIGVGDHGDNLLKHHSYANHQVENDDDNNIDNNTINVKPKEENIDIKKKNKKNNDDMYSSEDVDGHFIGFRGSVISSEVTRTWMWMYLPPVSSNISSTTSQTHFPLSSSLTSLSSVLTSSSSVSYSLSNSTPFEVSSQILNMDVQFSTSLSKSQYSSAITLPSSFYTSAELRQFTVTSTTDVYATMIQLLGIACIPPTLHSQHLLYLQSINSSDYKFHQFRPTTQISSSPSWSSSSPPSWSSSSSRRLTAKNSQCTDVDNVHCINNGLDKVLHVDAEKKKELYNNIHYEIRKEGNEILYDGIDAAAFDDELNNHSANFHGPIMNEIGHNNHSTMMQYNSFSAFVSNNQFNWLINSPLIHGYSLVNLYPSDENQVKQDLMKLHNFLHYIWRGDDQLVSKRLRKAYRYNEDNKSKPATTHHNMKHQYSNYKDLKATLKATVTEHDVKTNHASSFNGIILKPSITYEDYLLYLQLVGNHTNVESSLPHTSHSMVLTTNSNHNHNQQYHTSFYNKDNIDKTSWIENKQIPSDNANVLYHYQHPTSSAERMKEEAMKQEQCTNEKNEHYHSSITSGNVGTDDVGSTVVSSITSITCKNQSIGYLPSRTLVSINVNSLRRWKYASFSILPVQPYFFTSSSCCSTSRCSCEVGLSKNDHSRNHMLDAELKHREEISDCNLRINSSNMLSLWSQTKSYAFFWNDIHKNPSLLPFSLDGGFSVHKNPIDDVHDNMASSNSDDLPDLGKLLHETSQSSHSEDVVFTEKLYPKANIETTSSSNQWRYVSEAIQSLWLELSDRYSLLDEWAKAKYVYYMGVPTNQSFQNQSNIQSVDFATNYHPYGWNLPHHQQ